MIYIDLESKITDYLEKRNNNEFFNLFDYPE